MRTLPLVLVAAAALLSPAAALAKGPIAPTATGRDFVITGMVLGDQKADASGKLSLSGGQLMASVGCNTIGGAATLEGDTVTITEPLTMTAMGCLGAVADTEAMFIKVLQHGPFTITSSAWTGDGASLFTTELTSGPGPEASGGAPGDVVSSSPGAVIVDPGASCPPMPSGMDGGNGSTGSGGGPIDGGIVPPDAGSGSGGSSGVGGGTTPGSGGGTDSGSSGSGSAPSSTAVANPGTTTVEPAPPDPAGAPAPDASPTLGQTEPEPSLVGEPTPGGPVMVEPAPSAIAVPDPGTGVEPGGVEPGSSFDIDPGFNGKPIPVDPCERYYAVDVNSGAGSAIPPKAADAAAEHATLAASSSSSVSLPLGAALFGLLVIGAIGARRWWTSAQAKGEPEGPPAA